MTKIRITYTIFAAVLIAVAYLCADFVIKNRENFDIISYYGTVATLIGLLITVSEVINSVRIAKSVQTEARMLFNQAKRIEDASTISDCLAAIDEVSNLISSEDYKSAIRAFQYLRKICAKSIPEVAGYKETDDNLTVFGRVEFFLQKATHTTAKSPLTKRQKTTLLTYMLNVKQKVEELNPARNWTNATR